MRTLLLLLLLPMVVTAQPFPPKTTPFTRGLLITTDQTSAQNYLGLTPGASPATNTPIVLTLGGTGGTNVSGGDWTLGSGSGTTFKLILTTNAYFGPASFSNVPTTNGQQNVVLYIINPGTNTVTWTNSVFGFVNGVAPVQTTNGTDVYSLMNSLSTNGNIWVVPMNNLHR